MVVGSDSCVLVGPEIPDYRVQGEAVIIRFPFLEDAVNYRRIASGQQFDLPHPSQQPEERDP